jgi:hypothetical protein
LALGCDGKRRASVSGTVTIDKKAPNLSGLIISFVGSDGQAATAEVDADGSYQVSGVLVGENKVSLNWNAPPSAGLTPPEPGPDGKVDMAALEEYRKKVLAAGRSGPPDAKASPAFPSSSSSSRPASPTPTTLTSRSSDRDQPRAG